MLRISFMKKYFTDLDQLQFWWKVIFVIKTLQRSQNRSKWSNFSANNPNTVSYKVKFLLCYLIFFQKNFFTFMANFVHSTTLKHIKKQEIVFLKMSWKFVVTGTLVFGLILYIIFCKFLIRHCFDSVIFMFFVSYNLYLSLCIRYSQRGWNIIGS